MHHCGKMPHGRGKFCQRFSGAPRRYVLCIRGRFQNHDSNWCIEFFGARTKGERMNRFNQARMWVVFLGIAALLLSVSDARAKAPKNGKKAEVVKVEGTLALKLNDKKKVEAIEVTDGVGETYHIVVNARSKKQAKKLDGKQVVATGNVNAKMSKKKQQKWIMLKKLKASPGAAK